MPPDGPLLPPRAGLPVTLVLDDERMRARVLAADGERLELGLAHLPPVLRRAGSAEVTLEFVGERGPCRMRGSAATMLSDAAQEARVGFEASGAPQLLLLSERVRAPVEMEIDVDAGNGPVTRRTRDLRGRGALVNGPLQLEVDAEVDYRLRLPGRPTAVEGRARVARVTDDGDVALQLLELSEADYDDVLLATFEAQRSSRA